MTSQRVPGLYGQGNRPTENVDDGTSGPFPNFAPVPVGILRQAGGDLLLELQGATGWLDIDRTAARLLGGTSFSFGVVYGIGEELVVSAVDLAALAKVFVLADLYDAAHAGGPLWQQLVMSGGAGRFLFSRAANAWFGDALRDARDQRDAIVEAVRYVFTHPGEVLESVKTEYAEKWQRFEELSVQPSLSAQFEAGKIFGELLLVLLTVLSVGAGIAKLVAKFPKLLKLRRLLQKASAAVRPKAGPVVEAPRQQAVTPSAAGRNSSGGTSARAAKPADAPVSQPINITQKGLDHTKERHVPGGPPKWNGKSKFNEGEDVEALIKSSVSKPRVAQENGNFARTFDVGREIGFDRNAGTQTSTMTVITKPNGDLVTAFPGKP